MKPAGAVTRVELQTVSPEVARPNPGGVAGGHHDGQRFAIRTEDLDHSQSRVLEVGGSSFEVCGQHQIAISKIEAGEIENPDRISFFSNCLPVIVSNFLEAGLHRLFEPEAHPPAPVAVVVRTAPDLQMPGPDPGGGIVPLDQADLSDGKGLKVRWTLERTALNPGVGKPLHEGVEALEAAPDPAHGGVGIRFGRAFGKGGRHPGVVGLQDTEDLQPAPVSRPHGGFQRLADGRQRAGSVLRPGGAKHVGPGAVPVLLQVSQVLPVNPADAQAAGLPHHQVQGAGRVEAPAPVAEEVHRHGDLERRLPVDPNRGH